MNQPRLPAKIHQAVEKFGSPLNIVHTSPFRENISSLRNVAEAHDLDFEVYFARKANKCLSFVEAASEVDCGIDIASEEELNQSIDAGHPPEKIICTAAIKTRNLLEKCVELGVVVAVDNRDELTDLLGLDRASKIAIRLSGFSHKGSRLKSRFGFSPEDALRMIEQDLPSDSKIKVAGIHFHLDGYDHEERISAIFESLEVIDRLRGLGHEPEFLDIGGGFPISYLKHESEWRQFWLGHYEAMKGIGPSVTHDNHPLGHFVHQGQILGKAKVYPFFQELTRDEWLEKILDATAEPINERNIQLRCEPGRAILEGSGMTIARVEFKKPYRDGRYLIGLAMNRTQCRTSSEDFLVDPLLFPALDRDAGASCEGFLVGAYCTESEFLCLRPLEFPQGIERGDLVAFPNTAGYFMHFLESRSHQFPLAKNWNPETGKLDAIDVVAD